MFKLLPAAGKISLIKHSEASDDPEMHKMWQNLYRGKMTHWAVPTGQINDILVLDVDVKGNGYETLKGYEIPKTLSQSTPSGGKHYIFKYPKNGQKYGNRVKFLPGLDTRGDGGYIIWYGGDDTPTSDAPEWFLQKITQVLTPTTHQISTVKVDPIIAASIVQKSLDAIREAPAGESNNVLNTEAFRLGQLVASQSITRDYAFEALFRAAKDRRKPEYEARRTIESGLDGGAKKPIADPFSSLPPVPHLTIPDPRGSIWTPTATTRAEMLDYSKLRKPQLFEHWSTEDLHLTTADGGTGKTTLKLFEAVCLALGERFLGFRCISPGKTLFITGEDTAEKLKAMKGQILRQMGLTDGPYADEEKVQTVLDSIYIKKDSDLCLIVKDPRTHFLLPNQSALERVMQAVDDIRPKMIVFDPISSFWGSESALNDMAKAVAKFMSELSERSKACVEMINHMGKQSSSNKDMSQFSGRGGTGLPSHSRVVRTIRSILDSEYLEKTSESLKSEQSAMVCNVSKFSDGSPLYNKEFLIVRDGFLFSRRNLSDTQARETEQKMSDAERVFQFIKEARHANRLASKAVVIAHFRVCGNPIPKSRVETTLHLLEYDGHLGDLIKSIENPDVEKGGKVYTITDMDGKE